MKREPKAAWLWLQSFRSKSATLSTALTSVHSTSSPWYHMHNSRLKAPSRPQGKPNKLVKTKTETYLNRTSFWLPAKQQLCHSQCGSSIYPPLLITDVWPKPLALMLCERSGRTYQCHAIPGQQQPAMATPSQKQLKKELLICYGYTSKSLEWRAMQGDTVVYCSNQESRSFQDLGTHPVQGSISISQADVCTVWP